jgi:hypothetical protein
MWLVLVSLVVSASPPSPGAAVLRSVTHPGPLLLAQQAPSDEEQKALEEDMERARKRLGHDTKPATPAPEGAAADSTVPRPRGERIDAADSDDDRRPRRRIRRQRWEPTLDGHGKAYFLTWGIVDWSIAGGGWAAGTVFGLVALGLASAVNDSSYDWSNKNMTRSEARRTARTLGVLSVGLGITGAFFAYRAGHNLATFHDLRLAGRGPAPESFRPAPPPLEDPDE